MYEVFLPFLCVVMATLYLYGPNIVTTLSLYNRVTHTQTRNLHSISWDRGSLVTYVIRDGAPQLVHPRSGLCDFLGGADDIRRILQRPFPPVEGKWRDQSLFLIRLIQNAGATSQYGDMFVFQSQPAWKDSVIIGIYHGNGTKT